MWLIADRSFLAGSMPLSIALSARKLRFISAVGSGVLVGSSLTVIIPEGIEVLYGAQHGHDEDASSSSKIEPHAWVGLSLVSGFILMYLIDQLPQHIHNHPGTSSQPLHVSLSDLTNDLLRDRAANSAHSDADPTSAFDYAPKEVRKSSTSIGLVIHAAADGIALGASTSASTTDLGLVVFVAIMVHKVPAAFGLTSVLLKEGLTKRAARTQLIIFSLAAPAGALATWAVVNLLGPGWLSGLDAINFSTGVLLLFSGGTFLYVSNRCFPLSAGRVVFLTQNRI